MAITHAKSIGKVMYFGQLYPWKGVDVLVRAMRDVPRGELTVVGGLLAGSVFGSLGRRRRVASAEDTEGAPVAGLRDGVRHRDRPAGERLDEDLACRCGRRYGFLDEERGLAPEE